MGGASGAGKSKVKLIPCVGDVSAYGDYYREIPERGEGGESKK